MKKVLSLILAVAMLATVGTSVYAAEFVGSIEAKPAPEVIEMKDGGKSYGALIIDSTGETQSGATSYDKNGGNVGLEFVVVSAAEKSQAALQKIADNITNAENQIKAASNVGELSTGLEKDIQNVIDKFYGTSKAKATVNDLVVSDLFDASLVQNKTQLEQVAEGQRVRFTIKPDFTKNDFFVLLHNTKDTDWEVVNDVEWTSDGNLTVTVDSLSAFALVVEKSADLTVSEDAPSSPQTGNESNYTLVYAGIAAVCVGTAVVFFVNAGKKRKISE